MKQRVLVAMTNGDVYYISGEDLDAVRSAMEGESYKTVGVTDARSGARLVLQLKNISALVEEASRG